MKKKLYEKPTSKVYELKHQPQLLAGSNVSNASGNVFSGNVYGGSGDARARGYEDDDDWDF